MSAARTERRRVRRVLLDPASTDEQRDEARAALVADLSSRHWRTQHYAAAALLDEPYGSRSPGGAAADERRAQAGRGEVRG